VAKKNQSIVARMDSTIVAKKNLIALIIESRISPLHAAATSPSREPSSVVVNAIEQAFSSAFPSFSAYADHCSCHLCLEDAWMNVLLEFHASTIVIDAVAEATKNMVMN
jgi:hypothetical protein